MDRISADGPCAMGYRSPTDMGVNMAKAGIVDDEIVREAARQEIIRRYFRYAGELKQGLENAETVAIAEKLMQKVGVKVTDRPTVPAARRAAELAERRGKGHRGIFCGAALQLPSGELVTGANSPLLHAESALILNVIKKLARIPAPIDLLPDSIIQSILRLKRDILGGKAASLNVDEVLVALSISAATNPTSEHCMQRLKVLNGCDMHTTHVIGKGDETGLRRLGVNVTTDGLPTSRGFYY
jgi:uncharacterized protein (UPF0371 family)